MGRKLQEANTKETDSFKNQTKEGYELVGYALNEKQKFIELGNMRQKDSSSVIDAYFAMDKKYFWVKKSKA